VYVNIFRNYKRKDMDHQAYAADAARMEMLAHQQKGFIAIRRYTSADGEALSVSEWETEDDANAWARNAEHAAVQGRARAQYYESYVVYSCNDPRVRRFPADRS
jgi:heme-degrading monooxygenase HmoA